MIDSKSHINTITYLLSYSVRNEDTQGVQTTLGFFRLHPKLNAICHWYSEYRDNVIQAILTSVAFIPAAQITSAAISDSATQVTIQSRLQAGEYTVWEPYSLNKLTLPMRITLKSVTNEIIQSGFQVSNNRIVSSEKQSDQLLLQEAALLDKQEQRIIYHSP